MPWDPSDAQRYTHKAKSSKSEKQWADVANSVLARTGDDARAIREANSVVKHGGRKKHPTDGMAGARRMVKRAASR